MQSRAPIQQVLENLGLAERTITVFDSGNSAFVPRFYMQELGEIEGFTELEYAYKEFRVLMAKMIHPYSKGDECRSCSLLGICDGFHKDYADLFGFGETDPVKSAETILDPRHYMKDQMKVVESEEYDWALPERMRISA